MYYINDIDEAIGSNLLQIMKHAIASFHEIGGSCHITKAPEGRKNEHM